MTEALVVHELSEFIQVLQRHLLCVNDIWNKLCGKITTKDLGCSCPIGTRCM